MSVVEEFSAIGPQLPGSLRLLVRESVGSTNDECRALGNAGAADGTVVIADRQTEGRGRRGAAWFSQPGESLAFSLLARPAAPKPLWPRLALAAGAAVAEAAEALGLQASIKWPNDVWIGQRKLAGVLVEAGTDFAVIGIGINVNCAEFPPELAELATSLRRESGILISRAAVLLAVLNRLEIRRHQIGTGFPDLLKTVRLRCALTGSVVKLVSANGPVQGRVEGLGPSGELLLRRENGRLESLLQADEIRLVERG